MGWDCTYHLVDPTAIEKAFGLLVRGTPPPAALLAAYDDGLSLWEETRRRVLAEEPEAACRLACQLAIYLASATLPHAAERGVALSFGRDPSSRTAGVFVPGQYKGSPEIMFKPLLKKRPELAGRFHAAFETNCDTGVFIPARHVAAVTDVVRDEAVRLDDLERPRFDNLLRVLNAAARHGLAYWEATDLPVRQNHAELLAAPLDALEAVHPPVDLPVERGVSRTAHPCQAVGGLLFFGPHDRKAVVDPASSPPRFEPAAAQIWDRSVALLNDGRWLTLQRERAEAPRKLLLHKPSPVLGGPGEITTTFELPEEPYPGPLLVASGDGAVIVPLALKPGLQPFYWDGISVRRVNEFPPAKCGVWAGVFERSVGALRLGDGTAVVIWNGDAYEVKGGKPGTPWPLGISEMKWVSDAFLPWGEDGFYYTDRQALRRVRRGHNPEAVAKLTDPVYTMQPGPGGSVLLLHRIDRKTRRISRWGTLVFPDEGTEIGVRAVDVGAVWPHGDVGVVFAGGWFWVVRGGKLFRAPPEAFLNAARLKSSPPRE